MSKDEMNKKVLLIIFGLVILGVIGFVAFRALLPAKQGNVSVSSGGVLKQNEEIIPTVDASVQVELSASTDKKDAMLKISGIPAETTKIDFELTYEEKTKGLQGAVGSIDINGEKSYEKRIKDGLATCSSGKCVYHVIISNIKANLKFTGSYGEKTFVKEYAI